MGSTTPAVPVSLLAASMIRTDLTADHDVFVPHFLARHGFAAELASTAAGCNAAFVEIVLLVDRETARSTAHIEMPPR